MPYPGGGDAAATLDTKIQELAERVDLLRGEQGTTSITPSAVDTNTSQRVDYARSYAALAPNVPRVTVTITEQRTMAQDFHAWASAEDHTGFTLNIRASSTGARSCRWVVNPT